MRNNNGYTSGRVYPIEWRKKNSHNLLQQFIERNIIFIIGFLILSPHIASVSRYQWSQEIAQRRHRRWLQRTLTFVEGEHNEIGNTNESAMNWTTFWFRGIHIFRLVRVSYLINKHVAHGLWVSAEKETDEYYIQTTIIIIIFSVFLQINVTGLLDVWKEDKTKRTGIRACDFISFGNDPAS